LVIVKRDGKKESYNREKIIRGLKKALEKRSITEDKFKKLVHCIERDLQRMKKNEVEASEIGKIIMEHLKKIDQVAYIRFASVYESFEDAQEFRRELNKLIQNKKKKS